MEDLRGTTLAAACTRCGSRTCVREADSDAVAASCGHCGMTACVVANACKSEVPPRVGELVCPACQGVTFVCVCCRTPYLGRQGHREFTRCTPPHEDVCPGAQDLVDAADALRCDEREPDDVSVEGQHSSKADDAGHRAGHTLHDVTPELQAEPTGPRSRRDAACDGMPAFFGPQLRPTDQRARESRAAYSPELRDWDKLDEGTFPRSHADYVNGGANADARARRFLLPDTDGLPGDAEHEVNRLHASLAMALTRPQQESLAMLVAAIFELATADPQAARRLPLTPAAVRSRYTEGKSSVRERMFGPPIRSIGEYACADLSQLLGMPESMPTLSPDDQMHKRNPLGEDTPVVIGPAHGGRGWELALQCDGVVPAAEAPRRGATVMRPHSVWIDGVSQFHHQLQQAGVEAGVVLLGGAYVLWFLGPKANTEERQEHFRQLRGKCVEQVVEAQAPRLVCDAVCNAFTPVGHMLIASPNDTPARADAKGTGTPAKSRHSAVEGQLVRIRMTNDELPTHPNATIQALLRRTYQSCPLCAASRARREPPRKCPTGACANYDHTQCWFTIPVSPACAQTMVVCGRPLTGAGLMERAKAAHDALGEGACTGGQATEFLRQSGVNTLTAKAIMAAATDEPRRPLASAVPLVWSHPDQLGACEAGLGHLGKLGTEKSIMEDCTSLLKRADRCAGLQRCWADVMQRLPVLSWVAPSFTSFAKHGLWNANHWACFTLVAPWMVDVAELEFDFVFDGYRPPAKELPQWGRPDLEACMDAHVGYKVDDADGCKKTLPAMRTETGARRALKTDQLRDEVTGDQVPELIAACSASMSAMTQPAPYAADLARLDFCVKHLLDLVDKLARATGNPDSWKKRPNFMYLASLSEQIRMFGSPRHALNDDLLFEAKVGSTIKKHINKGGMTKSSNPRRFENGLRNSLTSRLMDVFGVLADGDAPARSPPEEHASDDTATPRSGGRAARCHPPEPVERLEAGKVLSVVGHPSGTVGKLGWGCLLIRKSGDPHMWVELQVTLSSDPADCHRGRAHHKWSALSGNREYEPVGGPDTVYAVLLPRPLHKRGGHHAVTSYQLVMDQHGLLAHPGDLLASASPLRT